MVILEKPYTSPEMAGYLSQSGLPVLDNATARQVHATYRLNLTPDRDFAATVNAGAPLYTTSENAIEWVMAQATDPALLRGVGVMKDKALLRKTLQPMYPDYGFAEFSLDAPEEALSRVRLPFIVKPAVGFFSVGVHVVQTRDDLLKAVAEIKSQQRQWRRLYPASVVGDARFLAEEALDGDEYALDAYYNDNGKPVILNIMKHDFSSSADVSDRLYYTSPEIILDHREDFAAFLAEANRYLELRRFPAHIEVRIKNGAIAPIEFNPLRFAGWCTTDLAYFAYGYRTYQHFLQNDEPDWQAAFAGRERNIYSLVILDKPRGAAGKNIDYGKLAAAFSEVLHIRKLPDPSLPVFGFLFTRTPRENFAELDAIVRSDLQECLI